MKRKIRRKLFIFILGAACAAAAAVLFWYPVLKFVSGRFSFLNISTEDVYIDFEYAETEIKDVNGINNGPKSGYDAETDQWKLDATELYRELEIPYVRIHDSEYPYGQGKFVDIHCIFPDFSADPEDPWSYDFTYTDKYIEAIIQSGAEVVFRLGESIDHSGENTYINPPEDYMKWAQVCEHIIRHYNEGWADGYQYGIQYWEIWNEPDNIKNWTGSLEQYYELYRTSARYLKSLFPEIKIGGYGAGACSEENINGFLNFLRADGQETPLDFFSWHTYTNNPADLGRNAELVQTLLKENGYENTESFLDEWNFVEEWEDLGGRKQFIQSTQGAAFLAASLVTLQNSPVTGAMYYDGQFVEGDVVWCGLYKEGTEKLPGYAVFQFFNEMKQHGKLADVRAEETEGIYCMAAAGDKDYILLANYNADKPKKAVIKLQYTGDKETAKITRINEASPNGDMKEETWRFHQRTVTVEPGETVCIELE